MLSISSAKSVSPSISALAAVARVRLPLSAHYALQVMMVPALGNVPQWSAVGDTFPVGAVLSQSAVFAERGFHTGNASLISDTHPVGCGFEAMDFSFSHDEYFARVLERSEDVALPSEAVYIVRHHSFYPWHTPRNGIRGYTRFASAKDWAMLPLLKAFQRADLYSKTEVVPTVDAIRDMYRALVDKYIPHGILLW